MRKLSMPELGRTDLEAFKQQSKVPIVVVLDDVRSFHNVGAVFRTSDAMAIEKVLLCGITPKPPHRDIQKTALGATLSVDWEASDDCVSELKELKAAGYKILGVEQTDQSQSLCNFQVEQEVKYAVVFGNEVKGIQNAILPLLDGSISIDQFGTKHSLNVSVCVGIVLWEMTRQIRNLR